MVGAKGTEQQNHCHFPILLGFFQGRAQRFKYKKIKGEIVGVSYSAEAESPLGNWEGLVNFQRQDFL
jgi:hypothetical protein